MQLSFVQLDEMIDGENRELTAGFVPAAKICSKPSVGVVLVMGRASSGLSFSC
jgi:hypothetical protein